MRRLDKMTTLEGEVLATMAARGARHIKAIASNDEARRDVLRIILGSNNSGGAFALLFRVFMVLSFLLE
jgi:hypothetical protein